jgi:hypothetical protein
MHMLITDLALHFAHRRPFAIATTVNGDRNARNMAGGRATTMADLRIGRGLY